MKYWQSVTVREIRPTAVKRVRAARETWNITTGEKQHIPATNVPVARRYVGVWFNLVGRCTVNFGNDAGFVPANSQMHATYLRMYFLFRHDQPHRSTFQGKLSGQPVHCTPDLVLGLVIGSVACQAVERLTNTSPPKARRVLHTPSMGGPWVSFRLLPPAYGV